MFSSLMRFFRNLGYILTGQFNKINKGIENNVEVFEARYEEVIKEKVARINQLRDAVAALMGLNEKKKSDLKLINADIEKYQKLVAGAKTKAQKVAQGKTQAQALADPEFQKAQSAYNNFASTLKEKEARADELEADIERNNGQISKHELSLKELQRDINKVKEEKHEAKADLLIAQEEKKIADALSNISEDKSANTLAELREQRAKAKAERDIAETMAGTSELAEEAEFMAEAENSGFNSELLQGITFATDHPTESHIDQLELDEREKVQPRVM